MSCKLGMTPKEDCESFAPKKKSDSSLSAGTGEFVDDDDRESLESSDIMMAGGWGLRTLAVAMEGTPAEGEGWVGTGEPELLDAPA